MVQPYGSTDTATTLFYQKSNFHIVDNQSITVHTLPMCNVDIAFSQWDIATEVYELVY